jgi:hypothetical protein
MKPKTKCVKLNFAIVDNDSGDVEFSSSMAWGDCDYADVTFLEDVILRALLKTTEAGYQGAAANGSPAALLQKLQEIAKK